MRQAEFTRCRVSADRWAKRSDKTKTSLDTLARFSYKKALHFEELHLKNLRKTSTKSVEALAALLARTPRASQNPTERRK
jgi:hypothetical protein